MIVNDLDINNFLTMKQAHVNLNNRGLVLISGVNEDDKSTDSNGAGKSTLVDALCWCLFGVTARGVTADEVVNDKINKDCSVTVKIADNDDVYEITRYRKHSINKNIIKVVVNGVDISRPTNAENDDLIQKLVGMNENIFKVAVYCGQDNMPYLPALTDKQIKELIENAAGISELQNAYELARIQKSGHSATSTALTLKVSDIEKEIDSLQMNVRLAQAKVDQWEDNRQLEIQLRTQEQTDAVNRFTAEIDKFKMDFQDDVTSQIEAVSKELQKTQSLRDDYEQKTIAANSALFACDSLANVINDKKMDIEHLKEEIAAIQTGLKDKCPTCGRTFSEADIETSVSSLYLEINKLNQEIVDDDLDLRKLHKDYEEKKQIRDEAKSKLPDTSALTQELQRLNTIKLKKSERYNQLSEMKSFLQQQKLKIDNLKNSVNPNIASLQSINSMLDTKKQELIDTKENAKEIYKQMTIDDNLIAIFSPSGVRAHILDVITPFLNCRTNKYLSTLSCGNLTAEWNTLNTTKSGVVKEKFQINVINKYGASNYKGLSGGEKRKVNLACVLALQDLASARAKKSFDLWIGDEIDNALDETGLELLMSVLHEKTQEKGTVLIISHNDLKDWISQNIVVTKKQGVSTINE